MQIFFGSGFRIGYFNLANEKMSCETKNSRWQPFMFLSYILRHRPICTKNYNFKYIYNKIGLFDFFDIHVTYEELDDLLKIYQILILFMFLYRKNIKYSKLYK